MPLRIAEPYDHPSLRALLADELDLLAPQLAGQAAANALEIVARPALPALPMTPLIAHWTRLCADGEAWCGALRGHLDDGLPFADDSFRVVLLRHAADGVRQPARLYAEAARVLEPEGLMLVLGFHPCSLWTPWLTWRRRHAPEALQSLAPTAIDRILARAGVEVFARRRGGAVLPGMHLRQAAAVCGPCALLLARKRRSSLRALRLDGRGRVVPVGTSLASGVLRNAA
ncbi:MAG: methyltransferase domain-containing protein [Xanthomonadaceae bacterium]|nr:methyltransferase domain-containing protein [Xanthomonadaceae bacterium]MDE1957940.1 methyltransferase domain-containing protein [Xanthomonadaceae bacterium]MDE2178408.1 methyltransferase domain-containing protein [Xanthomonadaceae bacterium]MDE2244823.1 methyltransferase domain-containing protein [Xanthomonadaceae bacterium]